jgi:hypothetical protein
MNRSSWKTTASAVLSAAMSFVLFSHILHMIVWPQWALAIAMFANIGGLAALGLSAKDYNVSGGQRGLTGKTGPAGAAGVDAPVPEAVEPPKP